MLNSTKLGIQVKLHTQNASHIKICISYLIIPFLPFGSTKKKRKFTHTHTHTPTMDKCKELSIWSHPQSRLGSHTLLQKTLRSAPDKHLHGVRPSTHRSTDLCLPAMVGGTQSPTCGLAEYGIPSGLVHPQPKSGPQFTVSLGPGWGAKLREFFLQWQLVGLAPMKHTHLPTYKQTPWQQIVDNE